MAKQMRRWCWVLVLMQFGVGCIGAEINGDVVEGEEFDAGVSSDAASYSVEIRDGALDLRAQARSRVEEAQAADAGSDDVEAEEVEVPEPLAAGDLPPLSGKPMTLYSVRLQEVEQGFQLSIPCTDDTVETRVYDRDIRKNRSERCAIDIASARASLEFDPAISYQLASTPQKLLVSADFERQNYKLKIKAGMRTRDGGALREDFETT